MMLNFVTRVSFNRGSGEFKNTVPMVNAVLKIASRDLAEVAPVNRPFFEHFRASALSGSQESEQTKKQPKKKPAQVKHNFWFWNSYDGEF